MFQSCEHHIQNSINLHCIKVEAKNSESYIWKPGQHKPKLSTNYAWLPQEVSEKMRLYLGELTL